MWYVVMSRLIVPREQVQGTENEHLAWMKQHHEAGNVLFSGPTSEGPGIWVLRASSREEAQKLADSHPWHARKWREYELFEWRVMQALGVGRFTVEEIRAAR